MNLRGLAWREYRRAFTRRAPGGYDWMFLTALLILLQLLIIIMLSARSGVLERSVDAFLGVRPGYGIPIWVRQNPLSSQFEAVSADLLDEIVSEPLAFKVAPFRNNESDPFVSLPSSDVWTRKLGVFSGLAAERDGPLFPDTVIAPDVRVMPDLIDRAWTIVLNVESFERYFSLEAYRTAVTGRIPQSFIDDIPDDRTAMTDLSVVWLSVSRFRTTTLVPFRVEWARHFGVGHLKPDFLLPLEFHTTQRAARENLGLCIDIASGPELIAPVNAVESEPLWLLTDDERAELVGAFKRGLSPMSDALGGHIDPRTDAALIWWAPEARETSKACGNTVPWLTASLFVADSGIEMDMLQPLPARTDERKRVRGSCYTAPLDELDLKRSVSTRLGWVGVQSAALTDEAVKDPGLAKPHGAVVETVTAGGPADKAGIMENDIVVAVDGRDIAEKKTVESLVEKIQIGETITMNVLREGRSIDVKVAVDRSPAPDVNRCAVLPDTLPSTDTGFVETATKRQGFDEIVVFADSSRNIDVLVDYITCADETARQDQDKQALCDAPNKQYATAAGKLVIAEVYEDSLQRLGFLSELLDAISGPVGGILVVLTAAILWVQLGTILGHRMLHYATLIVNGISHRQVASMVAIQIALGVFFAFAIAVCCFLLVRVSLLWTTTRISRDYAEVTAGNFVDAFPIPLLWLPGVLAGTLVVACGFGLALLRLKGLSSSVSLEKMLK